MIGIEIIIIMLIRFDKFNDFIFVYYILFVYQKYGGKILVDFIYTQIFCYVVFLK